MTDCFIQSLNSMQDRNVGNKNPNDATFTLYLVEKKRLPSNGIEAVLRGSGRDY